MNGRGFSLVEVMVAVAILFIGFAGVAQLFSGGLRINYYADEYLDATIWGRQKMEMFFTADSLETGEEEGEFNGKYGWTSNITLQENEDETTLNRTMENDRPYSRLGNITFDHYLIEVEVFWPISAPARNMKLSGLRCVMSQEGRLF